MDTKTVKWNPFAVSAVSSIACHSVRSSSFMECELFRPLNLWLFLVRLIISSLNSVFHNLFNSRLFLHQTTGDDYSKSRHIAGEI